MDGNKRLGWLAVVVFYGLNRQIVQAPDDDAYRLVMEAAAGNVDYHQIAVSLSRCQ